MMRTWRAWTAVILALSLLAIAGVGLAREVIAAPPWRVADREIETPIPRARARFEPVRQGLAPGATVGYISDPGLKPESATGWFLACRYVLAPAVIENAPARRIIIANYWSDDRLREGIAGKPLRVVAHLANGLAVLESLPPVATQPKPATEPAP